MAELRLREYGLVRSEEVFSPFWIDWVKFDVLGSVGQDVDLLEALLAHPQYAHDYWSPRDLHASGGVEHGPYILNELKVSYYESVLPFNAKNDLTGWLVERSEPEWTLRTLGTSFIDELPSGGATYRLPDMRPDHTTELGWIVGSDGGFNEWVFIDEARRTLTLVVATDD